MQLNLEDSRRCTELAQALWERESTSLTSLQERARVRVSRNRFWRMVRGHRRWDVTAARRILAIVAALLDIPYSEVAQHIRGELTSSSPILTHFARSRHWSPTERNGTAMARSIEALERKCESIAAFRRILPISLMPDRMRGRYFGGLAEQMEVSPRTLSRQLRPYAAERRRLRIDEWEPSRPQYQFAMLSSDFDQMLGRMPPFHYCDDSDVAECLEELYYNWIQKTGYLFCIIPDSRVPVEVLAHFEKYQSVTFFGDQFSAMQYRHSFSRKSLARGNDPTINEAFDFEWARLDSLLDCMEWQPWPLKCDAFEMFMAYVPDRMLGLALGMSLEEAEL